MASKSVFRSRLNLSLDLPLPVFSERSVPTFKDSFDSEGVANVVISGERNIFEFIQSFKDDTDIYSIINRLVLSGGELPNVDSSLFSDVTSLPSNVHEAFKSVREAQDIFNSLSSEKRAVYHNSFNEFMSDFGSEKFNSIFQPIISSSAPVQSPSSVSPIKEGDNND